MYTHMITSRITLSHFMYAGSLFCNSAASQLHLEFLTIPSRPIGQGYGIPRLITMPPNLSVGHSEAYHFNSSQVPQEACCDLLARAFLALVMNSPAYLDK